MELPVDIDADIGTEDARGQFAEVRAVARVVEVVRPALDQVGGELRWRGSQARLREEDNVAKQDAADLGIP